MKTFLSLLLILSLKSYARHIAHIEDFDIKPRVDSALHAPDSGAYYKTVSYHVTLTPIDPYSEEILFFLMTRKYGIFLGVEEYLKFHSYFKKEDEKIPREDEEGHIVVVGKKLLYPVIHKYFIERGIKISDQEFNQFINDSKEIIDKVKFIFSMKAKSTYYTVFPKDADIILDESGKIPVLKIRSGSYRLHQTIVTSKLYYYENRETERKANLEKVEEVQDEIRHIYKSLPSKRTSLKKHLENLLNKL